MEKTINLISKFPIKSRIQRGGGVKRNIQHGYKACQLLHKWSQPILNLYFEKRHFFPAIIHYGGGVLNVFQKIPWDQCQGMRGRKRKEAKNARADRVKEF